jgi:2-oxoglutarate dehydrogenase E2 component (dihydrolipoamide succinyltransferase)
VGESVTEALLAQWFKSEGDLVKKDEPLFVIETDKVTLEVISEAAGVLSIKVQEGETVAIGAVVGSIDTAAAPKPAAAPEAPEIRETQPQAAPPEEPQEPAPEAPAPPAPEPLPPQPISAVARPSFGSDDLAPSVRRLIAEKNLDPSQITGTGPAGRITKGDVVLFLEGLQAPAAPSASAPGDDTVQKPVETPPQPSFEKIQPGQERITPECQAKYRHADHL